MSVDLATAIPIFFTGLSTRFQAAYQTPDTFWQKIAEVVPSTTEIQTYAWMDRMPNMRQWLGPRTINNLSTRTRTILNSDYELTYSIPRNKFEDDQLGIYSKQADYAAFAVRKQPDRQILALLQNNPAAYDGQAFFSTAHASNLDDPNSPTYSNSLTLSLTPANFGAARAAMRTWAGADGNPFGAGNNLILVVPPQLEDVGRRIVMTDYVGRGNITPAAGVIPTDSAVTATAEVNIYKNAAELLVIPELGNQPTTWYLLDQSTPVKPFVVQVRQEPRLVMRGTQSDDNLFFNKEYIWGIDARWGFDVTLPFLALRSVG